MSQFNTAICQYITGIPQPLKITSAVKWFALYYIFCGNLKAYWTHERIHLVKHCRMSLLQ